MRTNITQYFCFPIEVCGMIAAEIEGMAELDVSIGESRAIIDMMDICVFVDRGELQALGDDGLNGALKSAIRAYFIDGEGNKVLCDQVDWDEARSNANTARVESNSDFKKGR